MMSKPDLPRPAPRIGARTTLQKLLSRFHFGITLFAVALSGLTILLAGATALRGYADRNMELAAQLRSEEHTSELQSLMRISYAVFCLKKKNTQTPPIRDKDTNT